MNEIKLLLRKDWYIVLNNIKLILKNPARLLPYIFIVGYFSFFYFNRGKKSSSVNTNDLDQVSDQLSEVNYELINIKGGLTLIALIFLMFQLYKATKKNISFFSMADVNLLFTGPVVPANILLYYMVRSIIPALGGSILFVVYSTAQLNDVFELTVGNILIMSLGFTLFFFILSPVRFLIYTLNTKYHILPTIKGLIFGLGLSLALLILIPGLLAEKFWQGMFLWISSPWFDFFPLVGWSRGIVTYLGHESLWIAGGFVTVYILIFLLIVQQVIYHSGYYYEDVLESTKSNEEVKEKAQKQEASESAMSLNTKKKLDLKNFGTGATALYWRNYVHASRQDFHPLFGVYALAFAGIAVVMAGLSHFDWFSHKVVYGYMIFLLVIYFFSGMGRTNIGDLKKPYFILIPASWTSKFWNMIRLDLIQTFLFSLALIVPTVLIGQLSWGLVLIFPLVLLMYYVTGFSVALVTHVGFEEGWDRKLIRPLIIFGVILFGVLPSVGVGVLTFIISQKFVYAMLGMAIGMSLVTAIMIHLTYDIISKVEFKEA
ncbi:putative ABC exporter domain-containing protein [Mongoliitalea daihaiensis]|uniref:putative ABC exporter domain-containing protein n=1 Tax=Mongoliitalea daihaiensis TaxID=2782006 RepID=UPI001F18E4EC|nr:putative ABC exporter domain-containing protein [Mongoliitalea daihaiensis]UJP66870.1 putative ABC exporter domain-containing protein [Mongoliitalea daihaiensis]